MDLVTSVSDSPLCHASNAKWISRSGFGLASAERKERCARLTADVAAKAVELLNAYKAGKFVPTFKVDDATTPTACPAIPTPRKARWNAPLATIPTDR